MIRERLPQRRHSEVVAFRHLGANGSSTPFIATLGFYEDGRLGEVFVDGKATSDAAMLAQDAAILISIALQHGVPVAEMRATMGRGDDGKPHTVIGTTLDLLVGGGSL